MPLDLKRNLVSLDTGFTKVELLKALQTQKGHYCIALKGNQNTLHEEMIKLFADENQVCKLMDFKDKQNSTIA